MALTLWSEDGTQSELGLAKADDEGAFVVELHRDELALGPYGIMADGDRGSLMSTPFRVATKE